MALITAPSVVAIIEDSVDTSMFYSISEEEESGKFKNVVSPFFLKDQDALSSFFLNNQTCFAYHFKRYAKPHLNLISPPPEQGLF